MPSVKEQLKGFFENLGARDFSVTSNADPNYNCIAWAAGDWENFWWPIPYGHWPEGVPRELTVAAFGLAFATKGFTPSKNGDLAKDVEKIALYTDASGTPTHAAFSLASGKWGSKLGPQNDIEHKNPAVLSGRAYGSPTHFFERPRPDSCRPVMPNDQK